jgi:predicted kinase
VARAVARELGAVLMVLDEINAERGFDGGEAIADHEWEATSFIAMDRLAAHLAQGRAVVVDDTFSHRFLRERCRAVAEAHGARFLILFIDTPLETIEARRAENARTRARPHIRDDVFAHHRARFEFPAADEPAVILRTSDDVAAWLARDKAERKPGTR